MRIKKGDLVYITTGRERGLTGRVRQVLPKSNRVVIEGRNIVQRHLRQGPQGQEGGILPKEASINASNVMLYSEQVKRGVRVRARFVGSSDELYATKAEAEASFGGKAPAHIRKVRYAPKTGEIFE